MSFITLAGRAPRANSTTRCAQSWQRQAFPPRGSNESYYSNPAVDQALFYALGTTDREKKSAIYAQMQETIWKDAPWIFLVSEQNIAASSKALHGFYIQPDSSFNFEEASLEPASLMKP